MAESIDKKPFLNLEKIPLPRTQEGEYIDLHRLKDNPDWVVKEQKDKRVWPPKFLDRELGETKQELELARKYLGDLLVKTMIVVGEADPGKNKYGNPKKLYFAQEKVEAQNLYDLDSEVIKEHVSELDDFLAGMVKIFEDSYGEYLNWENKTGIMLDFHLRNIFIGKKSKDDKEIERLLILDIFPMERMQYKHFLNMIENKLTEPLLAKGIDINGPDFPKSVFGNPLSLRNCRISR